MLLFYQIFAKYFAVKYFLVLREIVHCNLSHWGCLQRMPFILRQAFACIVNKLPWDDSIHGHFEANIACTSTFASLSECVLSSFMLYDLYYTWVTVKSEMTANLRHYSHSPILNIIKIRDKNRIFKLNSRKNTRWYFIL